MVHSRVRGNRFFALDQRQRRVILGFLGVERPHVVRVGKAEVFVKAMAGGKELRMMTQVPFAENGRCIVPGFDQLRERGLPVADTMVAFRTKRAEDADAVRVAARQQGRPRCAADRLRHIKAGETPPFPGQAVKIRSGEPAGAEDSHVSVALIVGVNDHNIRKARPRGWLAPAPQSGAAAASAQPPKRQRNAFDSCGSGPCHLLPSLLRGEFVSPSLTRLRVISLRP